MFNDFSQEGNKKKVDFSGLPWKKLTLVFLLALIIVFIRLFIAIKLDLTWFDVLGYSSVFWRFFTSKFMVGGVIFVIAAILNYINIFVVYKVAKKRVKWLVALPIMIIAALIITGNSGEMWLAILKALNAESFGVTDPQFQIDLSFYVFKLPFFWLVYRLVNTWLVINLIISAALYLLILPRGGVEINTRDITTRILSGLEKRGLFHIGILLGLLIAWQAFQYKLSTYELLYSQVGSVIGAGAADIGASLPAYYIMMALSVVLGLIVLVNFRRKIRIALASIAIYFIMAVLITGVYPSLYQKFVVDPDELGHETPYLERNIEYTRMAYGLNDLTEVEYSVGEITAADIEDNQDIINNIRLLDHRATMSTYGQQQEIRLYYDFVDVDSDRYMIDGELTQVLLSARELNQSSLPEQAQTFNNTMFKYTHGFGLAMSPANAINEAGLPQYLIKDIPPQSDFLRIEEPRIYFGEATDNNVIVRTGLKEFDYPIGDNNQEYVYQGDKGIPMTFINKVLLALRDVQIKYLLSGYITPDSQYLETRNIKERVQRIAPFLLYDNDPYMVLGEDGKIYYILDAYTATNLYPYSEAIDKKNSFNYLRNSVKIVMDAYTGEVSFYIFDEKDPIIKVYNNIFPDLFKQKQEFPEELKAHVRYPIDLFKVQTYMMRDYHMGNPTVFYNREDRWELASESYQDQKIVQEPYYSIIRLPGEEKSEFIIMNSFTPARKQNLVAWLAGRSDGDNYGKLLLYKFPKGIQIPGTMQVESTIDQDPNISSQLTLWGQGGSRILRGNLLVYPIGGSLIYVEPLYIEAEQNKFPQLKKIFVYYKDKIVMEDTLEEALYSIFGGTQKPTQDGEDYISQPVPAEGTMEELINRLITLYNQSKDLLKAGDWAGYGRVQEEIDGIVKRLETYNI